MYMRLRSFLADQRANEMKEFYKEVIGRVILASKGPCRGPNKGVQAKKIDNNVGSKQV